MDTDTIKYFDGLLKSLENRFTSLGDKFDNLADEVHASCTTLAVHSEKISVIENRCNTRGEDVKRLDSVEKKLDSHILTNGFTNKEIGKLKEEVKPYANLNIAGRVIIGTIVTFMLVFSFYKTVRETFSQPKTTNTIEVTK